MLNKHKRWFHSSRVKFPLLEVMRVQGPVLADGFLDVRFNSLRDVAVVGLITCERVVLGKGAKVLIGGSAQGICPPHPGR